MVAVFDVERWERVYPCLAADEYIVLAGIDFIRPPGDFNVLKAPIDALAAVSGLTSPDARFDAFKTAYGLIENTIVVDGVDITVYTLDTINFSTLREYLSDNPSVPTEICVCFRSPWGS